MAKNEAYREAEKKIDAARRSGARELDLSAIKGAFYKDRLTELPETLWQFTQLRSLDLSQNQLTTLPESLRQLRQLQALNLFHNQLTTLPQSLWQLTQLQWLSLSHNQLTTLPESLRQLTQLRTLNLSNNELATLPESLGQLRHLESLDLSVNQLITLPESLGQLSHLKSLELSINKLTTLPGWIAHLTNLRTLFLFGNGLTTLPESVGQLTQLEVLSVSSNQLTTLPESVGQLAQLEVLYARSNQLTRLPESLGRLPKLTCLLLIENQLGSLPSSLKELSSLESLFLHGNERLGLPREVLGPENVSVGQQPASPRDILDYYFRTRRGRRPLNEAKLILVGRGGAGKTCLIKRLIHGTFDEREPETSGIEIQPWAITLADGDLVRLHVWDFGGQEILHATHQFFLTERTVYLLVLSGREGTATQDAEYWLQLIRSFGADSPVIIALNKSQQHPFDVNRGLLLEKYPQIVKFILTDCERDDAGCMVPNGPGTMGTADLSKVIHGVTANLEHRKAAFPADWFEIKERLAGMKENFLSWDQYQEICRRLGEQDAQAQRDLAGFLHILGIALNYRDDPRLRETHVLNPRWVTEGIYSVLRNCQKEKQEREGVLDVTDLERALSAADYPRSSHEFLLALMEKFQLCFKLSGKTNRYLVPELLGENQPDDIKTLLAEPGLGFRFQYEILPEGLLPRFIVQTHALSEANPGWRWRTGVVLAREGCRTVVRADARERRVDIHITGAERPRRDLLAIIRERFEEQHRDLKGLKVDRRVPVPGEVGVTVSYEFLTSLEDEGEEWCRPEGSRERHRVAALLNGIELPSQRTNRRPDDMRKAFAKSIRKKHVFLSYCRDNADEASELREDLMAAGESVWWDQDILPGEDWKLAIDQAMNDSYAVVLCLSAEAVARAKTGIYPEASNAIAAFREYAPGGIFLIPVRFSDCRIPPLEIDATRRLDRLHYVDLFPPNKRSANLKKLIAAIEAASNHP